VSKKPQGNDMANDVFCPGEQETEFQWRNMNGKLMLKVRPGCNVVKYRRFLDLMSFKMRCTSSGGGDAG
jgi:hypothetical protein